jgi:hypothetical protein
MERPENHPVGIISHNFGLQSIVSKKKELVVPEVTQKLGEPFHSRLSLL